ncbi:MAG: undecaprenyl-diphosphate phosphatase [Thermodesulfobacteriota bacterium]
MSIFHALILALIQGVTEFLPISSTAHLVILPRLTQWPDQGLAFDVALNTATWLAVVLYFRSDLLRLTRGFFHSIAGRRYRTIGGNQDGRLAWMMLFATIPVGLAGFFAHDLVAGRLRTLPVVALSSIIWGIVLFIADRRRGRREIRAMGWGAVAFIGIAQAVALIPGTSRSGITITAGLFTGLSRSAAARFSFLLSVIVGALAGSMEGLKLFQAGLDTPWMPLIAGFVVAFISAYIVIHLFLKFITRASMTVFVLYRVALGILLLTFF